jgi:hypothetical protein
MEAFKKPRVKICCISSVQEASRCIRFDCVEAEKTPQMNTDEHRYEKDKEARG